MERNNIVIASERSERSNLRARRLLRRVSLRSTLLAMTVLAFFICGCGYTNKLLLAPGSDKIFVETFKNKIDITKESSASQKYNVYRPFLETKATDAVINKIIYDGNFKVVDKDSADLIFQGEVVNFLRQPLRYSDANDILEYRLNIMVNFTLKDSRTGKIILEQKNLTADASYFLTGNSAKTEDSAVDTLLSDLAKRVVSRIVNRW